MEATYKGTVISAAKGDLTKVEGMDALVIGADRTLYLDSGVCKAIHTIAGPQLFDAVQELGGCELGEARITPAFNAPCKSIIHVAAPHWEGGTANEEELLYSCYKNIAQLAHDNELKSVAMPSLGTGIYKWPLALAAKTGLRAITDFVDGHDASVDGFVWVLFDDATFEAYEEALAGRFSGRCTGSY